MNLKQKQKQKLETKHQGLRSQTAKNQNKQKVLKTAKVKMMEIISADLWKIIEQHI